VALVVPCYDEAARLDRGALRAFALHRPWLRCVLVDDGSRDGTRALLEELAREPHGRFEVLALAPNRGKAEAVRAGVAHALARGAACVGFWDADLATPLEELDRLRAALAEEPRLELVLGSRVRLLGHAIERHAWRHYFGRVAATFVSHLLGLPVYDTQCGAKLFRDCAAVREAFAEPFLTRWEFDVEILARWLRHHLARGEADVERRVREIPVRVWRDVPGSRLRPRDFLRAPLDLVRLQRRFAGLRRLRRSGLPAALGSARSPTPGAPGGS
jgi:glycosyltransferase involved in cell wall biosynthesis